MKTILKVNSILLGFTRLSVFTIWIKISKLMTENDKGKEKDLEIALNYIIKTPKKIKRISIENINGNILVEKISSDIFVKNGNGNVKLWGV